MWGRMASCGRLAIGLSTCRQTRPGKRLCGLHQPRLHGIHLDIPCDPLKLLVIANQPIVALILPEGLSGVTKYPIPFPSSKPLQRLRDLRNFDVRGDQQVNMIRHHNVRVQRIVPLLSKTNGFDDHLSHIRLPQIKWSGTGIVQQTIHRDEGLSGGGSWREIPIRWKAVCRGTK